jgi:hypothetical protein
MYFSEILMSVNVLPYLHIRQLLSITTNTTQTFIHTLIEKGNSQPFNNNLKIYKNQFSHI